MDDVASTCHGRMIGLWHQLRSRLRFSRQPASGPTQVYAMRLNQGAGVAGSLIRLSPEDGEFAQAAMHPAGQAVAYWGQHPDLPGRQIWVGDMAQHSCRPITQGPGVHGHPAWWPDGKQLVYFASPDTVTWRPEAQFSGQRPPARLYRYELGNGATEQLTEGSFIDERPTVTPDGKTVIFVSSRSGTGLNLWALDLESGALRQLTGGSTLDYRPVVAPDGQKIAYFTKGEKGRHILAIISWPEAAPQALRLRRNFAWVHGPCWAADSRHLLIHGLTLGDKRPALWRLDSVEGSCFRLALPGISDSSHGCWDNAQSWLAFDSRQALVVPPAEIKKSPTA